MKILSLETSTKNFSLAVSENEKILASRNIHLDKILSSSIIPGVQEILKKTKLSLPDLDGFAVGLGPGSFTSLRVGLSTVKAFAFATKKPVVGIPSLDIVAMNVDEQYMPRAEARGSIAVLARGHATGKWRPEGSSLDTKEGLPICVIGDAKRNLLFSCLYERKNGRLKRKTGYLLIDIKILLKKIKEQTLFVGDGIGLFKSEIAQYCTRHRLKQAIFSDEKDWFPYADKLAFLAVEKFKKKHFDDPEKLVPLYLYPDDCQVSKK